MNKKLIAIDIETFDPLLHTTGDGSCRHGSDGSRILCVGTFDGSIAKCYIPDTENWNEFKDILKSSDTDKVFHNGIYDLAWLCCDKGLIVNGDIHDTMTRMTYIDEYAELSLDACCKKMNVQGKNKSDTIEAWFELNRHNYSNIKKSDTLWKHADLLWESSKDFRDNMIQYNLQDCRATWFLYQAQEPFLKDVYTAYMVDVKLTPLIIKMKKQGITIDRNALERLAIRIRDDATGLENELINTYGIDKTIIGSSKQLGNRLNEMGIHSPVLSEKTGAESWGAEAMARLMHYPVIPKIVELKGYLKLLSTYIDGGMSESILDDGRIHCTFSPNKREDGGTVTGRFACSKPNLQQIPARDKAVGHNYGQDMRALFLPEEGCMLGAFDYSQIEYLLLGHFAVGPQAAWFREQANAGVDFHTVAMQATGIPSRQVVKTFNYGVIYGMGWKTAMEKNYVLFEKLANEKNESIESFTRETYDNYHAKLPVIRDTMTAVQNAARIQGYVKTIGGRYQHKPKSRWDPITGKVNDFLYKMLNKLIQGSAADILKFALCQAYTEGIFDILTMHITVHDENVVSIPFNKIGTEAAVRLKEIMDNSFKSVLKVPMKACAEVGPNWGYWSGDIWKAMCSGDFNPDYFNNDYRKTH